MHLRITRTAAGSSLKIQKIIAASFNFVRPSIQHQKSIRLSEVLKFFYCREKQKEPTIQQFPPKPERKDGYLQEPKIRKYSICIYVRVAPDDERLILNTF